MGSLRYVQLSEEVVAIHDGWRMRKTYRGCPVLLRMSCYYLEVAIDNNNNGPISDQDDVQIQDNDPTVELEPLSLEAYTDTALSDDAVTPSTSVSEIPGRIEADAENTVVEDQDDAVEELRRDNLELRNSVSRLEAELEDYRSQLAALRTTSRVAEQTSEERAPDARPVQGSRIEARWLLVALDGDVSDSHIVGDGVVTIGSSSDCDVHIESKFISQRHAQLVRSQKGCMLSDLNSTNGTFINSRRINKRVLRAGDIVTIGKHRFRYEKRSESSALSGAS